MENPYEILQNQIKTLRKDMDAKLDAILNRLCENKPIKRYSPQDISENTPLGIQTVWAAIKDGRIKAEKFGRKYLITREEFDRVCSEARSLKHKRTA